MILLGLLDHIVNGKLDIIIAKMRKTAFGWHIAGLTLKPNDGMLVQQIHPLGDAIRPGIVVTNLRRACDT